MEFRKTYENKYFSVDFTNDWVNVFKAKEYNWVEFNPIGVYFEVDRRYGQIELELHLFGFGMRFYVSYSNPDIKKNMTHIEEIIKKADVLIKQPREKE